jgi:hypothetical protein
MRSIVLAAKSWGCLFRPTLGPDRIEVRRRKSLRRRLAIPYDHGHKPFPDLVLLLRERLRIRVGSRGEAHRSMAW